MTNIFKTIKAQKTAIKELKKIAKDLPLNEEVKLLENELNKHETELNELIEKKKIEVLDVQKELFKAPTDEEIHQVVADFLSDDSKINEFVEIIQNDDEYKKAVENGKIKGTSEEIIETFKHPEALSQINKGVEKIIHALYRGVYKKLNKDLKLIKDSLIFTLQGRPEGRTEYTEQLYARVRARATELGYYKSNLESNYGDIKKILQQLVEEFKADGLNTPDSIKNCLKE